MDSFIKVLLGKAASTKRYISKLQIANKDENFLRRLFTPWSKRFISKKSAKSEPIVMPDPLELATGMEKKELLAIKDGNCDPFHLKPIKRGCGSADNPTLVPSAFDARIIGCICNDNRFINYMWLVKGTPKRCECGHWFRLKEIEPL